MATAPAGTSPTVFSGIARPPALIVISRQLHRTGRLAVGRSFNGDGYWGESNNTIDPRSLYYAQLKERLKTDLTGRIQLLLIESDATSSPTVAQAACVNRHVGKTRSPLYKRIIDGASKRQPIPTVTATGVKTIDELGFKQPRHRSTRPSHACSKQLAGTW